MKRNKDKRIFAKILIRYIICTVVFSIPLWVFADRYVLLIEAVTGSGSFYDIGTVIVTNLVLAFVITLVFMLRAARLLDREYDALDGIVDDDYVSPRLPNIISPRHKDVEEKIKKELKFKQYVANEAEQRKNDLVVYLAHDLKTPLTSIIGYLSLLDENPDFSVEYRAKYTGIALDKAYRLEQLINEFFDITRFNLQSFPLENNHIDLSLLLRQMAEEFYPVLKEKNLTCTVKAEDKVNIIGDSDKLSRVFDNLMRNASNYCYEGTNIEINVFKNGENAVVTFINQGDKIEKEKLDMIFEKFFRADTSRTSKTGGTGLGLAIANGLVSLSGSMFAQQQRFFDASMGVGTAVIGLASVIIGTALFGQISVFGFSISVILGSILYKGCVAAAIRIGLQSTDLKLVTAVLFLLILVLSSRIEKYQGRKRRKERA